DEITKILLRDEEKLKDIIRDDENLKDIIRDEKKLEKKIEELRGEPKTNKKLSLLGRLEFLQRNQKKVKEHKDIIDNLQNPQQASDNEKDGADDDFSDNKTNNTTSNQEEQKNKTINSKDIGDAGEYAVSMLFTKRSTRYLSNRRKLDANFNTKGFNHT
ncbi:TPA: hypothetical protein RZK24_001942, partial [Campylobacter coli]|nr:hypothetical protein [Campylobacter coli]HEB9319143.1 hypothetical protein [Campylobacter coli]